jgi:hypothetical protein
MAISSIGSNSPVPAPTKSAPTEATEATQGGKDTKKDGDSEAVAGSQKAAAAAPVVNTLGQQLGRNLNVTA